MLVLRDAFNMLTFRFAPLLACHLSVLVKTINAKLPSSSLICFMVLLSKLDHTCVEPSALLVDSSSQIKFRLNWQADRDVDENNSELLQIRSSILTLKSFCGLLLCSRWYRKHRLLPYYFQSVVGDMAITTVGKLMYVLHPLKMQREYSRVPITFKLCTNLLLLWIQILRFARWKLWIMDVI